MLPFMNAPHTCSGTMYLYFECIVCIYGRMNIIVVIAAIVVGNVIDGGELAIIVVIVLVFIDFCVCCGSDDGGDGGRRGNQALIYAGKLNVPMIYGSKAAIITHIA